MTPEEQSALQALPDRQRRIVHGLALWRGGWSIRAAARECGTPPSTLHDHTRSDAIGRTTDVRALVEPLTLKIALEAGQQTLEALHEGSIPPQTLPIVFGVAVDKLSRLAAMDGAAGASPLSKLMELLHTGGSVTLQGPTTTSSGAHGAEPQDVVDVASDGVRVTGSARAALGSRVTAGVSEPRNPRAPAQKPPE